VVFDGYFVVLGGHSVVLMCKVSSSKNGPLLKNKSVENGAVPDFDCRSQFGMRYCVIGKR
jgi:hypothetical protein